MSYTYYINWINEKKEPLHLTDSEMAGIQRAKANNNGQLPQWLEIRGEMYNTAMMDSIKRVRKATLPQFLKCPKCHDFYRSDRFCVCELKPLSQKELEQHNKRMEEIRAKVFNKEKV